MAKPKQKERLEYIDDLTGLHNRRYFREKLLEEKRRADKKGSAFALTMIDLDNFKPINDLYGHLTGDQVLSQVAASLKKSIRPSDILCRYAGDEFVVILPEIKEDDVIRVAERIKDNLAQASLTDEKGEPIQPVTCSVGYSFYAEKGRDLEALVGWADQALYAVKRRGGNGHCGEKDIPKESIGRPLVSTPHLVGRDKESARLRSLVQEAHQGKGRLVLIHGEAGVGKTRLVKELQQILERKEGTVLVGGCHEETRAIHYYPFREAFNRLFNERKEERSLLLENLPDYSQRELARILPGLTEMQPSELDRATDPFRLFEAIRLLLVTLTKQAKDSLLFIVEDLHWSDGASLDLLQYLARNLKETGVLLCGTYRTEEAVGQEGSRLLRFAGSLQREGLSEEIALEPLSAESIFAMVRLLYPGMKVSQEFQDFLYQKTEGNPFFVEELLKFLTEEEVREGLPKIQEVPQSVHAVLQRRIDSLDPGTKDILACGALIGEEFEFEVLHRVLDRPQEEILEAVEGGMKSHIVRESLEGGEDRYRFVHGLIADVLYSGIGKTRRRLWHSRAGESLEKVYKGRLELLNGQLAYHFERAEKWEKAVKHALRSAGQAKEDYANQDAIYLYEKAKEVLPRLTRESRQERTTIANGLGDVYQLTGNYERALEEYRLLEATARKEGDGKKEGDALSKIGQLYQLQGNYDEMMNYAERAYAIHQKIGNQSGLAESLHSMGIVHWNRGNYEQTLKSYDEALKIRREIGDKRGVALSLHNIGIVHASRGNYRDALKCYEESLKLRRELDDKSGEASSLNSIGNSHVKRGDYAKALKCYEKSLKIRREIGDKRGVASSLHNIGILHMNLGDYGKALRCSEETMKIRTEIGDKWGVALSLHNIGDVHWNRGDHGDALKCYEEALNIRKEIGDKRGAALSLHNIGIVHANRGDYGNALKWYEEALKTQRDIGDKWGAASSLDSIGAVHWNRGDYKKALKCYEEALKTQREIGNKSGIASSLNNMGIVYRETGDYKEAAKCLRESLRIARKIGEKSGAAFALMEMGTLHQGLYDIQKAIEHHEDSLALIEEMEMNVEKAAVLSSLGTDHHLSGKHRKALQYLNEALTLVSELGVKETEPEILGALSEVHLSKGNSSKANGFCEQLLGIAEKEGLKRHLARTKKIKGEILLTEAISGQLSTVRLKEAEKELKEAARIAKKIGAFPLLWQIHASLGRLYQEKSEKKNASEQFKKAKKIIKDISSKIGDEKLKKTFLNSKPVRTLLT